MPKKVVDLNDKHDIAQLSHDIAAVQGLDDTLTRPLKHAISTLKEYDETHELSIDQIRQIYSRLHIHEQMTPQEMEHSLNTVAQHIAILEKKFIQAAIDKDAFSALIRSILRHFGNIVAGDVLTAITSLIENFSCLCLLSKKDFSYKDVCFKFFTKHPASEEVLVLVLNIHYERSSLSYKLLKWFKFKRNRIYLNFLGALVKTEVPTLTAAAIIR